ncbi:hypothetical protein [Joostella sp. CR20]|uniref:hypothetical protein n=1 Tax=Joostella sp. CR20 TaxID=2804312 RepID=UPI00313A7C51
MLAPENKKFIYFFIFSGLIFATIMALFDVADRTPFQIKKFIFFFLAFGFLSGLDARNRYKRDNKTK